MYSMWKSRQTLFYYNNIQKEDCGEDSFLQYEHFDFFCSHYTLRLDHKEPLFPPLAHSRELGGQFCRIANGQGMSNDSFWKLGKRERETWGIGGVGAGRVKGLRDLYSKNKERKRRNRHKINTFERLWLGKWSCYLISLYGQPLDRGISTGRKSQNQIRMNSNLLSLSHSLSSLIRVRFLEHECRQHRTYPEMTTRGRRQVHLVQVCFL